ncbi:thioredoxin-domain-containing protein [Cadophora sp. DSE1049]|nr:thioredoxin-domain-containing protein [Cadophora sp. DSE1049]
MLEITSLSHFNALKSSSDLLIIDFYATWCGPCKAISPVFARLATSHSPSSTSSSSSGSGIIFAQVDVDKAKDVAQTCGITAMPTFQFYRGGRKIDEVKGADSQQLSTKVGWWVGEVRKAGPANSSSTSAKTNTQGGGASSSSGGAASSGGDKKVGSLRSLIDIEKGRLLNATLLSSVRNIASPPPAGYSLASTSSSPKLLIYIPFTSPVYPSSISIRVAKGADLTTAPSRITVGSNVPVVFRKVEDKKTGDVKEESDLDMESSMAKAENEQRFEVFSDEFVDGVVVLKLKGSKFGASAGAGNGVKSLLVRVERNLGGGDGGVTKIGEMDVLGVRV